MMKFLGILRLISHRVHAELQCELYITHEHFLSTIVQDIDEYAPKRDSVLEGNM